MRKKIKVDFFALDRIEYEEKVKMTIKMLTMYGRILDYIYVQDDSIRYVLIDMLTACSKEELMQALKGVADDFEVELA